MGKLVQVATTTVTSAVASVTLTGIDSDDVYMLTVKDFQPETNIVYPFMQFTESGTANPYALYDYAFKNIKAAVAFSNMAAANINYFYLLSEQLGTATQEKFNAIYYIYNANNSSEYTFFTQESTALDHNSNALGTTGGGVFTNNSAVDGVKLYFSSGNIASGTFTLYRCL